MSFPCTAEKELNSITPLVEKRSRRLHLVIFDNERERKTEWIRWNGQRDLRLTERENHRGITSLLR